MKPIPENYQVVMPYLLVENSVQFLDYVKAVFQATELAKVMRDENSIMHGEVKIGDSTIMFSEVTETFPASPAGMFVFVDDADATFKKALDLGGKEVTRVSDQSYGRSGGVLDPFGNTWCITSPL
ncbi:MAG: VOC family protein [Ferruginibacter sp.]